MCAFSHQALFVIPTQPPLLAGGGWVEGENRQSSHNMLSPHLNLLPSRGIEIPAGEGIFLHFRLKQALFWVVPSF